MCYDGALMQEKPTLGQARLATSVGERGAGRIARNRLRIAWMYYVEGLTQSEIADKLGIGRVTVVRNINEAQRQGEVKIWIEGEIAECFGLERELKRVFGLDDAVVVPEPANAANIAKSIGIATGMFISDNLVDDMSIGVGWGATLYESLQTLTPREVKNLQVISMLGGIVQARNYNPSEFAWRFAMQFDADCYLLAAPAVVDSVATKKALIERCGLGDVLARARRLDMAVMSIGGMNQSATLFRTGFVSDGDRRALIAAGAVGDVLHHFFDRDGRLVDHPLNDRIVSIPIAQVRAVPRRVVASGGAEKVEALLGALRLLAGTVLITNEETARALIARGSATKPKVAPRNGRGRRPANGGEPC